jgi:glycerol-3-phosphate dehydrogenase
VHPRDARTAAIAALGAREFDLLVIGGGITGCGIARDAALRGLDVALVEKDDFASGTSSRSSRLIHGGVRYLEHGHLGLVFESSAERRRLLRLAPHLVHPLVFTWPVYAGARVPRWKLGAGLLLYDALAMFRNVGRHRRLSARGVLAREPQLRRDGLRGGAVYYDASTNDARLTLANALDARAAGATLLNHARARDLCVTDGTVRGVNVVDAESGEQVEVRAKVVVNATGPWSDDLRRLDSAERPAVRGSKGAHVVVPNNRVGNGGALTLLSPTDGRVLFVVPSGDQTIIGTTDTFTSESPDDVRATAEDQTYLLNAANFFFPAARLAASDVISAWAGIRPLIPTRDATPQSASREHEITESEHGLVSITGGKLTTYRVMAADVVGRVLHRLGKPGGRAPTKDLPLFGGRISSIAEETAAATTTTRDAVLARHLVTSHGDQWRAVWASINGAGDGREPLAADSPITLGELRYSVATELTWSAGDFLIRRTRLATERPDHGRALAPRVAAVMGSMLGWDEVRISKEVVEFEREAARVFGSPLPR